MSQDQIQRQIDATVAENVLPCDGDAGASIGTHVERLPANATTEERLRAAELDLEAIEPGTWHPKNVNHPASHSSFASSLQRLVAQGVEPAAAFGQAARIYAPALVRGRTQHPTPSRSTTTPTIAQRAFAARRVRPADPVKRQIVDGRVLGAWWDKMAGEGPVWILSLNLSPRVAARALNSRTREPLDNVRDAVNRRLAALVGRPLRAIIVAGTESKGGPRFHVHMLVRCEDADLDAVYAAARLAGGHKPRPSSWCLPRHRKKNHGDPVDIRRAGRGHVAYLLENAEEAARSGMVRGKVIVTSGGVRGNQQSINTELS